MENDAERFARAVSSVVGSERMRKSIGTYSESTLHAVLKSYYEPDTERQELRVGKYCADIVSEDGIIEIQTRSLFRLVPKLRAFLSVARVTVVFPVSAVRYINRIDGNGTVISRRKSPKKGTVYDAVPELYALRDFLSDPSFRFCVCLLETEDYKTERGFRNSGTRLDRIPTSLVSETVFSSLSDYGVLLPEKLPEKFTSSDVAAAAKIPKQTAQMLLALLNGEAVERVGRVRNGFVYIRKE